MDRSGCESWLERYGTAWARRDRTAASALSTPDACYYWTPFSAPQRGKTSIAEAWQKAVSGQEQIECASEFLAIVGNRGMARWWCSFVRIKSQRRVKLDGIFQVDFVPRSQANINVVPGALHSVERVVAVI